MLLLSTSILSHGGNSDNGRVSGIVVTETLAIFGLSSAAQPAGTCSYFGRYFSIDVSNPTNEKLYELLLQAKAEDYRVKIWFTDSLFDGADQTNGCDIDTLAEVIGIGIQD